MVMQSHVGSHLELHGASMTRQPRSQHKLPRPLQEERLAAGAFALPPVVFPVVFPDRFHVAQLLLRYRHPSDPVILLLAAVALETVIESFVPQGPGALSKPIGIASHSGYVRP
jgi:hypothetical protein